MATKPITTPLPADLPENWSMGQTVAPAGTDVGLTQQHGYNYLMQQVNAAQEAVNTMNNAFEDLATGEDLENQTAADVSYTNNSQSTVAGALDALFQGLADGTITSQVITATSSGWSGDIPTQTLNVMGINADTMCWVGLDDSANAQQRDAARKAVMSPTAQGTNSITLTCDGVQPTVDLPILIYISGGAE